MKIVDAKPGMLLSREGELPDGWIEVTRVEPDAVWAESHMGRMALAPYPIQPKDPGWDLDWFEVDVDHRGMYPVVTKRVETDYGWLGWRIDTPLHEAIGEAIGAASMCWEHVDQAGVFNSEQASRIVDALEAFCHAKLVGDAAH